MNNILQAAAAAVYNLVLPPVLHLENRCPQPPATPGCTLQRVLVTVSSRKHVREGFARGLAGLVMGLRVSPDVCSSPPAREKNSSKLCESKKTENKKNGGTKSLPDLKDQGNEEITWLGPSCFALK